MAVTDFGALTEAQRRVWAAEAWQQGQDESFFFRRGFIGKTSTSTNSPVQLVTGLSETERGLECVMQLVSDMQTDGVVGDNILMGQEEALVNSVQVITIDMLRNGVRSRGEMAEQATVLRFRAQAKDKLTNWLSQVMDELCFLTISGRPYSLRLDGQTRATSLTSLRFASGVTAPTSARIIYAGTATSEGTLTTVDTMSWNFLINCRAKAQRARLKPIRDGGSDHYAVVLSTEQGAALKKDPVYQTIVSRAGPRSSSNHLFTGALAVADGLVLHEHNKVFNTLGLASGSKWGAGGTVDGAQAILMGAQSMAFAAIGRSVMRESGAEGSDYGNRPGLAFGRKFGLLKPVFPSIYDGNTVQDFGTIAIKTAASSVG